MNLNNKGYINYFKYKNSATFDSSDVNMGQTFIYFRLTLEICLQNLWVQFVPIGGCQNNQ